MATTSTATTSAAHNCIPGDEVELLNHICVLVLTRGDGTPFDTTSIQEEDIIEICIQLEQTHPKGVLQYSAAQLVILFQSVEEMLVMAHGVIKAMAFHEEPITLRTSTPSAAHMWAFMAARDEEPSGTQSLTPDRGMSLHHPLMTATWVGGPHINYRQTLGTLQMPSCGSSWRISAGKLLSGNWNHPQEPTADPLG